jgi:uncharacterized protein YukE
MDPRAVASGGEPEPLWAEVVDRVICDGRPGFLRDAADRYELLQRRMHDEATAIEDLISELAQSWDGAAFAAYHAAVESVVDGLRVGATQARAIADALRLAADLLRAHQERIPVPVRLGAEVFRAHHQRRETAGGVAPSNADFERAIYADIIAQAPWLTGPEALELANTMFHQQQKVARQVYRELSAAYGEVEALLPDPAAAPAVSAGHRTHTPRSKVADEWAHTELTIGGDADETEAGAVDVTVHPAIGADDDNRLPFAGRLSGAGSGPALGGGSTDTGAAFGTPVSIMSTPGVNAGLSMGTGTHLSTPMGSGYGGVIGVVGEGETHSTWLTEDDDPFEQDGQSSGAVLS